MPKPIEEESSMDIKAHVENLKEINRDTSRGLWRMGAFNKRPETLGGRLIFPAYSEKANGAERVERISEQEARFVYSRILEGCNGYFYSIETPTEKSYSFSSKGERSAMSDLSLYKVSDLTKVVNVEFKAHNPDKNAIHKDVVKLVKEAIPDGNGQTVVIGNWYHLLQNADKGTIPSILQKFQSVFDSSPEDKEPTVMKRNLETNETGVSYPEELYILFTFCVLNKRFALEGLFKYSKTPGKKLESCWQDFFNGINCSPGAERDSIFSVSDPKQWTAYYEDGPITSQ